MEKVKKSRACLIAIDCVVFGYLENRIQIALIKRNKKPFKGNWALPGGLVERDETVEQCTYRELLEETGIKDLYLKQCGVMSDPQRDPRGRVVSITFFALIPADKIQLSATEDASSAQWFLIDQIPKLAFDHQEIIKIALTHLQKEISQSPIIFNLLPKKFTLSMVQSIYEEIFNKEIDKRNFRKKILSMPYIVKSRSITRGQQHRPAQLYYCDMKFFKNTTPF